MSLYYTQFYQTLRIMEPKRFLYNTLRVRKNIKYIILLFLIYKYKNYFFYYYKHKKFYYIKLKTIFYLIIYKFCDILYGVNINDKNLKYINWYIYENFYKIPIIFNFHNDIEIESITTNDIDITSEVLPYMGPNYNFYNMNISPKDLQYSNLKFIINDKEYNFNDNELIKFY